MKKVVMFVFALLIFSITTHCFAGDEALFVAKCGACHKKGGKAAPVNPADKAGSVWGKYFKRNRHPVDISKIISTEELTQIINYLKGHAADSDQPAAAVIPR